MGEEIEIAQSLQSLPDVACDGDRPVGIPGRKSGVSELIFPFFVNSLRKRKKIEH